MTKVATYSRYSSDAQSDMSIEDQERILRERAEREGWRIVENYSDRAISGSTMIRPGIQALLRDAQDKKFDVVLAESVDRLSRDMENIAGMHKRLSWLGINIVTLLEGEVSDLHIGLKGTMSQLYLKELSARTHRGQQGRALAGESTGGKAYGYDVTPRYDERGRRIGGLRAINPEQAAIVRRIFTEFVGGKTPKTIAVGLNKDGVLAQGGREWAASTIYGNRQRLTGLLNNELYVGRQIWNKQQFRKNPDTNKTNGRMNDRSEWVIVDVPELRIIDDELWNAAKARQEATSLQGDFRAQRRPKRLFSFLLKCGECGGGFSRMSHTHYGCSTERNRGTCDNTLRMSEKVLQKAVLDALTERLMQPELCALFCKEYAKHINDLQHGAQASRKVDAAELNGLDRKIARLIEAIKNGVDPNLIKDEINGAQARRVELQMKAAVPAKAPVFIHPQMARRYQIAVQDLIELLKQPDQYDSAAKGLRALIEKIVLTPNSERSDLIVDLYGDLAGILAAAARSTANTVSAAARIELGNVQALAKGADITTSDFQPEVSDRHWRLGAAPARAQFRDAPGQSRRGKKLVGLALASGGIPRMLEARQYVDALRSGL